MIDKQVFENNNVFFCTAESPQEYERLIALPFAIGLHGLLERGDYVLVFAIPTVLDTRPKNGRATHPDGYYNACHLLAGYSPD